MREVVVYTLMFSAMLQLLMGAYAWGRRGEPAAKPLMLVFALGAVWAFGYGMEMASADLQGKLFWLKIYWTAASFGPFIFLLIVLEHLEMTRLLTRGRQIVLLIPSLLLIALVWSVPHHDLLLYDFSVERIDTLDILRRKNGVIYTPIFLVLQGISIYSYYLLIQSLRSSSPVKRRQSAAILAALLIPFIVNIPSVLNIDIAGFDFTPHALVLSSALFAYAIFRYRWLDLIPLARSALVETLPVGVIVMDAKARIVDINPSAKEMFGMDDSAIGQEARAAFGHLDPFLYEEGSSKESGREIGVNRPARQPRVMDVHFIPLTDQDGQSNGRILTLHDVTERKHASESLQAQLTEIALLHDQLHEQAIRDPLTGLFNRRYMNDALEREMRRAERHQRPLGILMIEIDDFKKFNDAFGHDAGDTTLKRVAKMLKAYIRTDDIACRFGGDEFIMILPETTLKAASQCAERLCENAAALKLEYEGKPLRQLTFSIGVAIFPQHGDTMVKVIRAADEAMYQAKQTGKNRVVVST